MSDKNQTREALETEAKELNVTFDDSTTDAALKGMITKARKALEQGAGGGAKASKKDAASIIVTGPKAGRRRAGRRFGPEPTTITLSDLKKGELEALRADRLLSVTDA